MRFCYHNKLLEMIQFPAVSDIQYIMSRYLIKNRFIIYISVINNNYNI